MAQAVWCWRGSQRGPQIGYIYIYIYKESGGQEPGSLRCCVKLRRKKKTRRGVLVRGLFNEHS